MDGGGRGVEAVLLLPLPDVKLLKTPAIPPAVFGSGVCAAKPEGGGIRDN